jgi:hypothetical protein
MTCIHEYDKEKTKQLKENGGFLGYGTRHYVCKKCGVKYIFGSYRAEELPIEGYEVAP